MCCVNSGLARRVSWETKNEFNGVHYAFAVRQRNAKTYLVGAQKRDSWDSLVLQLQEPKYRAYLNKAKRAWMAVDKEEELEDFYFNYPEFDEKESDNSDEEDH